MPPELMLIASKKEIENPQVQQHCQAVWPKGTSHLRGIVLGLEGVLLMSKDAKASGRSRGGYRDVLEAPCDSRVQPEAAAALADVKSRGLRAALLAGRSSSAAAEACSKALSLSSDAAALEPALTQDSLASLGLQAEPSKEPIDHICQAWGVQPDELLVVGCCGDLLRAGREAGARTCLVLPAGAGAAGSEGSAEFSAALAMADATVSRLSGLKRLLSGFTCDTA